MFSQVYYIIRSQSDGRYVAAHPETNAEKPNSVGYLLMFSQDFEALTYLNTHGANVANRFAVESIPGSQLNNLLKRWGFTGVAVVRDPLLPTIEFFNRS